MSESLIFGAKNRIVIDSLGILELVSAIEERFNIDVDIEGARR